MDSEINILGDSTNLATPFSVKNLLNLNSAEATLAGEHSLGTVPSPYALDSLVSVCSSVSQNAAAAAAAMSGYPPAVSSASYHHMDPSGLMMGHPAPHLHHGSHPPGDLGGGSGLISGLSGGLSGGLDISSPSTSSSCEYGGGGSLLAPHHSHHLAAVPPPPPPPAAAPVPPSYSSLPDLTQATLRLGSEFGLQDGTPPPPVTSPPSSISSLASTSHNLCPASSNKRDNVAEKGEFKTLSWDGPHLVPAFFFQTCQIRKHRKVIEFVPMKKPRALLLDVSCTEIQTRRFCSEQAVLKKMGHENDWTQQWPVYAVHVWWKNLRSLSGVETSVFCSTLVLQKREAILSLKIRTWKFGGQYI